MNKNDSVVDYDDNEEQSQRNSSTSQSVTTDEPKRRLESPTDNTNLSSSRGDQNHQNDRRGYQNDRRTKTETTAHQIAIRKVVVNIMCVTIDYIFSYGSFFVYFFIIESLIYLYLQN